MDHMATKGTKARKPKDETLDDSMRLRCKASEKEAWTRAAERDGRDLSGWLRHLANTAVNRAEQA
jgi:uncharacterized protein (DUF1778 family)